MTSDLMKAPGSNEDVINTLSYTSYFLSVLGLPQLDFSGNCCQQVGGRHVGIRERRVGHKKFKSTSRGTLHGSSCHPAGLHVD